MIEKMSKRQVAVLCLLIGLLVGGVTGYIVNEETSNQEEKVPLTLNEDPTEDQENLNEENLENNSDNSFSDP